MTLRLERQDDDVHGIGPEPRAAGLQGTAGFSWAATGYAAPVTTQLTARGRTRRKDPA
jgi:hypothetical protein